MLTASLRPSAMPTGLQASAYKAERLEAAIAKRETALADALVLAEGAASAAADRSARAVQSAEQRIKEALTLVEGQLSALGPAATHSLLAALSSCREACAAHRETSEKHVAATRAIAQEREALLAAQSETIGVFKERCIAAELELRSYIVATRHLSDVLFSVRRYATSVMAERIVWQRQYGLNPADLAPSDEGAAAAAASDTFLAKCEGLLSALQKGEETRILGATATSRQQQQQQQMMAMSQSNAASLRLQRQPSMGLLRGGGGEASVRFGGGGGGGRAESPPLHEGFPNNRSFSYGSPAAAAGDGPLQNFSFGAASVGAESRPHSGHQQHAKGSSHLRQFLPALSPSEAHVVGGGVGRMAQSPRPQSPSIAFASSPTTAGGNGFGIGGGNLSFGNYNPQQQRGAVGVGPSEGTLRRTPSATTMGPRAAGGGGGAGDALVGTDALAAVNTGVFFSSPPPPPLTTGSGKSPAFGGGGGNGNGPSWAPLPQDPLGASVSISRPATRADGGFGGGGGLGFGASVSADAFTNKMVSQLRDAQRSRSPALGAASGQQRPASNTTTHSGMSSAVLSPAAAGATAPIRFVPPPLQPSCASPPNPLADTADSAADNFLKRAQLLRMRDVAESSVSVGMGMGNFGGNGAPPSSVSALVREAFAANGAAAEQQTAASLQLLSSPLQTVAAMDVVRCGERSWALRGGDSDRWVRPKEELALLKRLLAATNASSSPNAHDTTAALLDALHTAHEENAALRRAASEAVGLRCRHMREALARLRADVVRFAALEVPQMAAALGGEAGRWVAERAPSLFDSAQREATEAAVKAALEEQRAQFQQFLLGGGSSSSGNSAQRRASMSKRASLASGVALSFAAPRGSSGSGGGGNSPAPSTSADLFGGSGGPFPFSSPAADGVSPGHEALAPLLGLAAEAAADPAKGPQKKKKGKDGAEANAAGKSPLRNSALSTSPNRSPHSTFGFGGVGAIGAARDQFLEQQRQRMAQRLAQQERLIKQQSGRIAELERDLDALRGLAAAGRVGGKGQYPPLPAALTARRGKRGLLGSGAASEGGAVPQPLGQEKTANTAANDSFPTLVVDPSAATTAQQSANAGSNPSATAGMLLSAPPTSGALQRGQGPQGSSQALLRSASHSYASSGVCSPAELMMTRVGVGGIGGEGDGEGAGVIGHSASVAANVSLPSVRLASGSAAFAVGSASSSAGGANKAARPDGSVSFGDECFVGDAEGRPIADGPLSSGAGRRDARRAAEAVAGLFARLGVSQQAVGASEVGGNGLASPLAGKDGANSSGSAGQPSSSAAACLRFVVDGTPFLVFRGEGAGAVEADHKMSPAADDRRAHHHHHSGHAKVLPMYLGNTNSNVAAVARSLDYSGLFIVGASHSHSLHVRGADASRAEAAMDGGTSAAETAPPFAHQQLRRPWARPFYTIVVGSAAAPTIPSSSSSSPARDRQQNTSATSGDGGHARQPPRPLVLPNSYSSTSLIARPPTDPPPPARSHYSEGANSGVGVAEGSYSLTPFSGAAGGSEEEIGGGGGGPAAAAAAAVAAASVEHLTLLRQQSIDAKIAAALAITERLTAVGPNSPNSSVANGLGSSSVSASARRRGSGAESAGGNIRCFGIDGSSPAMQSGGAAKGTPIEDNGDGPTRMRSPRGSRPTTTPIAARPYATRLLEILSTSAVAGQPSVSSPAPPPTAAVAPPSAASAAAGGAQFRTPLRGSNRGVGGGGLSASSVVPKHYRDEWVGEGGEAGEEESSLLAAAAAPQPAAGAGPLSPSVARHPLLVENAAERASTAESRRSQRHFRRPQY